MTPEEQPVVLRETYPVRVSAPGGLDLPGAKLVVTLFRVYVFTAGGPTGVQTAYEAEIMGDPYLPPPTAPRSDAFVVPTVDGELRALREPGCGCAGAAAAVKHYRPFPNGAAMRGLA